MNRNSALLSHFGLDNSVPYWGADHERYAARIHDAVQSRRLVGVLGGYGCGKSTLVRESLKQIDRLKVVWVNTPDKENLRIGDIMEAVVYQLSEETPKRSRMARVIQVARIIGSQIHFNKCNVAIVIDNAHRMYGGTFMALKDLRESCMFRGNAFLFTPILVGHQHLRAKINKYGEVKHRTSHIDLEASWMNVEERVQYIGHVYKDVVSERARSVLAVMKTSPLQIDAFMEERLEEMRALGVNQLSESDIPFTILEAREHLGVSYRELGLKSDVPSSTVHDVIKGRNSDPETRRKITSAIEDIIAERTGGAPMRRVGS